jgi:hypothetical protein
MTRQIITGFVLAAAFAVSTGCGSDTKTEIPTKIIEPPGPDMEGGGSNKAKGKTAPATKGEGVEADG